MMVVPGHLNPAALIQCVPANNYFTPFAPKQTKKRLGECTFLKKTSDFSKLNLVDAEFSALRGSKNSSRVLSLPKLPPLSKPPNRLNVVDFSNITSNFASARYYSLKPQSVVPAVSIIYPAEKGNPIRSITNKSCSKKIKTNEDKITSLSNNKFLIPNSLILKKNSPGPLPKLKKVKIQTRQSSEFRDSRSLTVMKQPTIDCENIEIKGW